MRILIPLGGLGSRFKKTGFSKPKALIEVLEKEIIFHLIDNLVLNQEIDYLYIPYHRDYVDCDFERSYNNNSMMNLVMHHQIK